MRIERLDLLRFGKFEGRTLDLPRAERDFHVIVGPNEAGKSTVRAAIADLLYGIPARTPHAFLHAMPDLRLGARVEHSEGILDFIRTKGNKQTLRDVGDTPLPDSALAPFLGGTDRSFFEQMFGLDHQRLIEGGHNILSASNDLGQILFQSAAGIASLGPLREALENEADTLWSARRSGTREWYIAQDALEAATKGLKDATVRTKDWTSANASLREIDEARADALRTHAMLRTRRDQLERIRRTTPHLRALDDALAALTALGPVADLPESAATTLAESGRLQALAGADIEQHNRLLRETRAALESKHVDRALLALATEIHELNEQRLQYRAHDADILRRQSEIDAEWRIVFGMATGLGWDATSEEALRARLPRSAARASLDRLARSHEASRRTLDAAARESRAKRTEIERAREELAALGPSDALPALQAAMAQSQRLGDLDAALGERRAAIAARSAALEDASAGLGRWRCDTAMLRSMSTPSPEFVASLLREQDNDRMRAAAVDDKVLVLQRQVQEAGQEIARFRKENDPVTLDDVRSAREARERLWSELKASPEGIHGRAQDYERRVSVADQLSDRRHETAEKASGLLAMQAQCERLEQELSQAREDRQRLAEAAATRADRWTELAAQCALPPLPLEAAAPWMEARRLALDAADRLHDASLALESLEQSASAARHELAGALSGAGTPPCSDGLAALMLQADGMLAAIARNRGRREALEVQLAEAARALDALAQQERDAQADVDAWRSQWSQTLDAAGFGPDEAPESIEATLETIGRIDEGLESIRRIRTERIDRMREDLGAFARAARALSERIAPELASLPASDIAIELAARLQASEDARRETNRLHAALDETELLLAQAQNRMAEAQASLAPLHLRAGSTTDAELVEAISRSDIARRLRSAQDAATCSIGEAADGLALEALREEAGSIDAPALREELEELARRDDAMVARLNELAAQRQAASAVLDGIAGADAAARAEAARQAALARMAQAAERYVKVRVAVRLLKWSIERYREERQGPMLASASGIFSRLTLGSFEKLTVDFDGEPPRLQGRRPDATTVDIEGMSEGTRDQLYLALRLAALEMHLGQAHALPFVADDLFINYDDRRSQAGLEALGALSRSTQVLFLTHHAHLLPVVRQVFGERVNVIEL